TQRVPGWVESDLGWGACGGGVDEVDGVDAEGGGTQGTAGTQGAAGAGAEFVSQFRGCWAASSFRAGAGAGAGAEAARRRRSWAVRSSLKARASSRERWAS